jgi:hypothetical protein
MQASEIDPHEPCHHPHRFAASAPAHKNWCVSFERCGGNASAAALTAPSTTKSSISRFVAGYSSGKHSGDGWGRSANSSGAANYLTSKNSRCDPEVLSALCFRTWQCDIDFQRECPGQQSLICGQFWPDMVNAVPPRKGTQRIKKSVINSTVRRLQSELEHAHSAVQSSESLVSLRS